MSRAPRRPVPKTMAEQVVQMHRDYPSWSTARIAERCNCTEDFATKVLARAAWFATHHQKASV